MLANQSGCVCTKRENLAVSSSPLILPKLQLGDQSRNNRRNHFNGFELILTKKVLPTPDTLILKNTHLLPRKYLLDGVVLPWSSEKNH